MKIFKFYLLPVSLVLTFSTYGFSQTRPLGNEVAKLKQLEYDWLAAEFKLDTTTISTMMDERFISIGLNGVSNKQQELQGIYENISARLKNDHIVDSFYLDEMKVQIFDNTAIVTFVCVTTGTIKKLPFQNRRTRMNDVWIKRKNEWKAISSQVTPLPK